MLKCVSRILLLVIVGLICGTGVFVSIDNTEAASPTVTVKGSIVNVRAGPGTTYNKISTVKKGAKLEVVDRQKGWYKLKIAQGITGWVISDYLTVSTPVATNAGTGGAAVGGSAPAANKSGIVTGQVVNIRSGPGTSYPLAAKAKKGQQFTVTGESSGWYKLTLAGGKTGWIIKDYLSVKPPAGTGTAGSGGTSANTPGGKYVVIKETTVNIRAGAGTNYSVVAKVKAPEKYSVVQQKGEWYLVNLAGQKQGWVAGWVVDLHTGSTPSRDGTGNTPPPASDGGTTTPSEGSGTQEPGNTNGNTGTPSDGGSGQNPANGVTTTNLTDITFEAGNNGEEIITIDADRALSYNLFSVADPLRLVIDIKNCAVNGFRDFSSNGELASQVRAAQYSLSPMAVRIVVDLSKVVDYVPTLSQDGKRLTITLSEPTIEGKIIAIDAGHGDYDPGAIGVTGLQEKDFNLETALLLRDKLTALGATVVLTRDQDKFISLTERCRIANEANADIFVAIHANSSSSSSLRGTSTYYYAPSSNPKLYAQEEQRKGLAGKVQQELVNLVGTRNIGTLQANFAVLRGTNMPSILVESAFLSNSEDEALLKDSNFRDQVAQGIASGLQRYFSAEDLNN